MVAFTIAPLGRELLLYVDKPMPCATTILFTSQMIRDELKAALVTIKVKFTVSPGQIKV